MYNFTDGLNCIPRIATGEEGNGNRVLDRPCTKHSFKRKQNLLFVNVKKKIRENPDRTLRGGEGRPSRCLSSQGMNLKMTPISVYP